MSFSQGQTIGPYKILERAGVGGMGEVFKANDTRLDRTVAIKVLPALYQHNQDLQARFEREARAISQLNHPNICTLYDVGYEEGKAYLVLEYLEGDTLSQLLEKGPLETDAAVRYAIEIADALERAHKQGLVHRDLKPGNIIITKDGAKLLDFGLAKLQIQDGVVEGMSGATQAAPLTGQGTILGTIQYMSPEQLDGKEVDQRSDIFSFGAVLYEMVTGNRAFQGASQASVIAAIMKEQPRAVSEIQPLSPPMLERAIKQCLAKDPDQRWQSAGDLKRTLQWIREGGSQAGIPAPVSTKRRRQLRLSWIVAAVAICVAAVLGYLQLTATSPTPQVHQFAITEPQNAQFLSWPQISPDGKLLAFMASDSSGATHIWIRPLNSLQAYPLPGTENVHRPFWSPDSRYLAFSDNGQIKKIPAQGGPAVLVGQAPGAADGSWGSSGIILFDGAQSDSIRQIPASGGAATSATTIDHEHGDLYHAWPSFLPDGNHFLYLAVGDTNAVNGLNSMLHVGSLDGSVDKALFAVQSRVQYSNAGYILHTRDGILFARKFDAKKLEVSGESVPIAQDVFTPSEDRPYFSVSANGILSYVNQGAEGNSKLVWFDRSGRKLGEVGEPADYRDLSLSPDGTKLAYTLVDQRTATRDIWVRDLERNVASRLTFGSTDEIWPIWSRDGTWIAYAANPGGFYAIYERQANGLGDARLIYSDSHANAGPSQFSADDTYLIGTRFKGNGDIYQFSLTDTSDYHTLIATPHHEARAQVSPDGKYIAYISDESGPINVYVRSLSAAGGKWQVSPSGGYAPKWRADGKELVYYTKEGDIYSVSVDLTGGEFKAGVPERLFHQPYRPGGIIQYRYDMTADAQKFLINSSSTNETGRAIVMVMNWPEELKEK